VVLLNWNGGEYTIPCIKSLQAGKAKPWKIIVVDNASVDHSDELIAAQFPEVKIIRSNINLGFTGGNNVGIRELINDQADYIWILNNDTVVDSSCLKNLLDAIHIHKDIAAVTAKIYYQDPADVIWYAGDIWHPIMFMASHQGAGEKDEGRYEQRRDVRIIDGCCIFARREAFEIIGIFDNRYFAYHEDIDWSFRARRAGYRLIYVPSALIWHKVSGTIRKMTLNDNAGTATPLQYYLSTRNHLYLIRRYATRPWQFLAAIAYSLIYRVMLSFVQISIGRYRKTKAIWKGFYHGLAYKI
jgi:GT2 family glycosyltransferase